MLKAVASGSTSASIVTPSGTFSSKPASPSAGQQYFATDLGTGILIVYTGSKWKPSTGEAVLLSDSAVHTGAGTGAEANYFTATIPAGLLSTNGALRITAIGSFTGTNGTKTVRIRHNTTSGAVTGGTAIIDNVLGGTGTALSVAAQKTLFNVNDAAVQMTTPNSQAGYGTASAAAVLAGAINTANTSYLNFNIVGNALDTVGYQGIIIEWIEP